MDIYKNIERARVLYTEVIYNVTCQYVYQGSVSEVKRCLVNTLFPYQILSNTPRRLFVLFV